jgi:hypothetical protein
MATGCSVDRLSFSSPLGCCRGLANCAGLLLAAALLLAEAVFPQAGYAAQSARPDAAGPPGSVECRDLDNFELEPDDRLQPLIEQAAATRDGPVGAALRGASKPREASPTRRGERGGFVLSFGLRYDDDSTAEMIGERLSELLLTKRIPAAVDISRVSCPRGAELDEQTAACFDARVLLPYLKYEQVKRIRQMMACHHIARQIETNPLFEEHVSFIDGKGFQSGERVGLLFALRNMLANDSPTLQSTSPEIQSVSLSSASATSTVTVDQLVWTDSTRFIAKDSVERRVLAPGFDGTDGSSGIWVLYALGARVGDGKVKCLRARFRNLWNPAQTTSVEDPIGCDSVEKYVELTGNLVATGIEMKVSDNDVKGIGLGYGTPSYEVDPVFPDFLTGVAPQNYLFSGSSSGTYAPESARLTSTWPYVVVGVSAAATNSSVSGLTAYLGRLTAPEPGPDDLWQGHTVADLESAVTTVLNAAFDAAAQEVTFEAVPDCPSTIPDIRLCGYLSASGSYSTSEMDSVCAGTCDAYYESCKLSLDACKVACCYGCTWGKWCTCNYNCSGERSACCNGCTDTFTGSVDVDVTKVTGLEKLEITKASIPFLVDSETLGVDATAVVANGLKAYVYWKLCQSGICIKDTSTMSSSKIKARARASLTARSCPAGPPAVYLTIADIELIDLGIWNIDELVSDITAGVQSSMDWLAANVSDLFDQNLQGRYDSLMQSTLDLLQGVLNELLVDTPVIACQS